MTAHATEIAVEDSPGRTAARTRRCFVTRRDADPATLVRFVAGPDGAVVPDVVGTLPGRGLWLSAERDVVHTASAKNLFARGLRTKAVAAPDLADQVARLLARRCLDFLGLARRGGVATAGYERVRALLRSGSAGVLISAADGAEDGRRKLIAIDRDVPVVTLFTAAELAAALGRENAVHAALKKGGLADRFVVETRRLAGFRRAGGDKLTVNCG